jgi:hypothetical protein
LPNLSRSYSPPLVNVKVVQSWQIVSYLKVDL